MAKFLKSTPRRGLTLVELLVVIGIIVLLMALMLPAVQKVRAAADRLRCANNLHNIALAAHHYHGDYGRFPSGARIPVSVGGVPTMGTNLWVELLPYFEQDNLYKKWDYDDNRNNVGVGDMDAISAQVIKLLICPSDPLTNSVWKLTSVTGLSPQWAWGFYGLSSYGGNAGTRSVHTGGPPNYLKMSRDGIFYIDSRVRFSDIIDGTTNTFLFGERYHDDPEFDRLRPQLWNDATPVGGWGRWAYVANSGAMFQVTLHTAAPINYRVSSGGNFNTLENRGCAFGSGHPRGANFAFADGSVRFLSDRTPLLTLQALSTRAGGEVVSADDF